MADTMKAARIHKYGKSGVLEVENCERPEPGPDEILVKVHTASLNPRDWLTMRGIYQMRRVVEPFPITLGSDFAGEVAEMGSDVTGFAVGDLVCAMQPLRGKFGAFAEYVKIKASVAAKLLDGISTADAAAMPCAGMTSYQTLHDVANVQPGEVVLVNGASGGVGVYAVQIAKAMGAKVVAVCGPNNMDFCLELGADEVINYREDNFATRENAYDVVYDVIGRSSPKAVKKALKTGGRYITTIPGPGTAFAALTSYLLGFIWPFKRKSTHLILVKPYPHNLQAIMQLILDGKMKTIVDGHYALDDIEQAVARSQTWRARGKIMIDIS